CKLELSLATNLKNEGKPEGAWMSHVDSAEKDRGFGLGGADGATIDDLRHQIDALAAPPSTLQQTGTTGPNPIDPTVIRRKKIDKLLQRAVSLYKEASELRGDPKEPAALNDAEAATNKVLELDPENHDARELLKHISNRKVFLAK